MADLHDVRVLQPGDGLGLGQKAGVWLRHWRALRQDHLEGAWTVEAHLPRAIDDAHAASAQLAQNLVAGNRRSRPLRCLRRIGGHRKEDGLIGLGSREIFMGKREFVGHIEIVRIGASNEIGAAVRLETAGRAHHGRDVAAVRRPPCGRRRRRPSIASAGRPRSFARPTGLVRRWLALPGSEFDRAPLPGRIAPDAGVRAFEQALSHPRTGPNSESLISGTRPVSSACCVLPAAQMVLRP